MILNGTRVKRRLEFFNWVGTIQFSGLLRDGNRLYIIQLDNGSIFCAQRDAIEIVEPKGK